MGKDATLQVLAEIPFHVPGQTRPVGIVGQGEEGLEVLLHDLIEHRLGRTAPPVEAKRATLALPSRATGVALIHDRFHSRDAIARRCVTLRTHRQNLLNDRLGERTKVDPVICSSVKDSDPRAQWMEILQPLAKGFVESQLLDAGQSQVFVQFMAGWMTGIFAAGFYFQLMLAMLLARAWQAGLYNPGGFREEFHGLDIGRPLGVVALVLFGLALVLGDGSSTLARELALLLAPLFLLQGLAVAHRIVAALGMSVGWLVALYLLLFFAMPHAALIVILVGLVDVFVDFRGRLKQDTRPDS